MWCVDKEAIWTTFVGGLQCRNCLQQSKAGPEFNSYEGIWQS